LSDFLEINQGIFVKTDDIEAVIDTSDSPDILCKIYTANNSYPSALPSGVILEMLGIREEKSQQSDATQEQILNIMKEQTNVMGG
jgi:hypothetical protein